MQEAKQLLQRISNLLCKPKRRRLAFDSEFPASWRGEGGGRAERESHREADLSRSRPSFLLCPVDLELRNVFERLDRSRKKNAIVARRGRVVPSRRTTIESTRTRELSLEGWMVEIRP